MKKVVTNCYGICIHWDGNERQGATITSNLRSGISSPSYLSSMGAIESMILAHFVAGLDITERAYLQGVEASVLAMFNRHKMSADSNYPRALASDLVQDVLNADVWFEPVDNVSSEEDLELERDRVKTARKAVKDAVSYLKVCEI